MNDEGANTGRYSVDDAPLLEAEHAFFGAILSGAHPAEELCALSATDFVGPGHAEIFSAMACLASQGALIDVVTVFEKMRAAGQSEDRLPAYLNAMATSVPSASRVAVYAEIITQRAKSRHWTAVRARVISMLNTASGPAEGLELVKSVFRTVEPLPGPVPTWLGPHEAQVGSDWIDVRMPDEPFVIEHLLPVDAVGFIGAGGVGKSTFLIWLLVHVILGLPVFGYAIPRPGPVLYVSAEDRRGIIKRRLQLVCDAMELSRAEKEQVSEAFFIEDVSGKMVRIVRDQMGAVAATEEVAELIEAYRDLRPSVVVLDPISLLGPGERSVNDGMSELMRTARQLSHALQSSVVQVHHESKAGVRAGVNEQYSGRGGAAFADNARAVLQLVPINAQAFKHEGNDWTLPQGWEGDDVAMGNILGLFVHKLTAERRDRRPIIVRRHGFAFEAKHAVSRGDPASFEESRDALQAAILEILIQGLTGVSKVTYSVRSLSAEINARKLASRAVAESAVNALLQRGVVLQIALPQDHHARRGARKDYLVPVSQVQLTP